MADVDAARRALEDALGAGEVLSDPLALRLYARDASMVEGGCALVAFPRTRDDIVTCVRVAAEHGLPIVPRGSGTGLVGGSTPIGDALVVVTTKMTGILEIRPQDRLAWVEPGVPNLDLANALRPHGFTFAPDPSSQQTSSIGGNVSTNAGGPHCLAYGVTSNHVLALDVVLADGSVARLGSEAPETAGLRPARGRDRERGDARDRRGGVRSADAAPAGRADDAVRLRDRRGLRGNRERDHRERRGPRRRRDDGPRDRGRGRGVRARGVPDRRRGDPDRRGRRHGGRRRGAGRGGRGGRAREPHPQRPGRRRRGRTRADLEGAQERVRRGGDDRAALPPARLRRAPDQARGRPHRRVRDRRAPRADRHERVPRRRREPAPAPVVRPRRARDARTRPARERGDRPPVRRGGRGALGRARDRAREARLHAAGVLGRGPFGAGVRAVGVRHRGADEPAEGAAGRRSVRRLRDGAGLGRRRRSPRTSRRARGSDPPVVEGRRRGRDPRRERDPASPARGRRAAASRQGQPRRGRRRAVDHPARPAGGLRAGRDDRGGRGRHAGRRARTDPGRGRPGVAERRTRATRPSAA